MTPPRQSPSVRSGWRRSPERGSALITALLFAFIITAGLAAYLGLGRTTLVLANRTFFGDDALNLAEAGLEASLHSFNLMGSGTPAATAWAGWTITGADATRTLAPFNLDEHAVGIVKVFVHGYAGTTAGPYVISQATIAPFDGGPSVVKIVQISLQQTRPVGVAALAGLALDASSSIDSFNSNPTGSPTGPWADYSSRNARANATVGVLAGSVRIGRGEIHGDLQLGAGVSPPPARKVTGSITTNFAQTFPLPAYPAPASVSQSYDLGSRLPSRLPEPGDRPASDGRYYYFCRDATIGAVTIHPGDNVVIVGTRTDMTGGLTVDDRATCTIYLDGPVTLGGNQGGNGRRRGRGRGGRGAVSPVSQGINATNWAGALHITTSYTGTCRFANNSVIHAVLYAPYAALDATGSGGKGELVGSFVARTITASGKMAFHYDEALASSGGTRPWTVTAWLDRQSAADRAAIGPMTNDFLP